MTKDGKEETAGLRPMGVQRLRELRQENGELRQENEALRAKAAEQRQRITALEQALKGEAPDAADPAGESVLFLETFAPAFSGEGPPEAAEEAGPVAEAEEPPAPESGEAPPIPEPGEAPPEGEEEPPVPKGRGHPAQGGRDGPRAAAGRRRARRRRMKVVSTLIYYLAIALFLAGAVMIRAAKGGAPFSFAGYSGMLVLSESMQDVLPKGSFILTKWVEPWLLAVGDDITYMVNPTTSVTHRIVDIRPQNDGSLRFQTKGVNNTSPDSALVTPENIVGKVVYHNLLLGLLAQGISDNWPLLLFLLGVWTAMGWALRRIIKEDPYQGKHLVCGSD